MKINIILFLLTIAILSSCQRNEVIKTHGISYLEKREKLIIVNESNKNDIISLLGPPSTKGSFDNDIWIYIERQKTGTKIYTLGKKRINKNNVLILEINEMGLLAKKDLLDIENMNEIKYSDKTTTNAYSKNSFVYSFLSSMRQRINDPLGKRKKAK